MGAGLGANLYFTQEKSDLIFNNDTALLNWSSFLTFVNYDTSAIF